MPPNGEAYRLVSEEPFDIAVSERIISAFSNADAPEPYGG
jgi:hypothetical protein